MRSRVVNGRGNNYKGEIAIQGNMQCGRHIEELSHGGSSKDTLLVCYRGFVDLHHLLWNEQFAFDGLLPHYRTQVSDKDLS